MHFYESSIITTKDGLHCQVYGNEHPVGSILVKPKYIPTDKVESSSLQYRFISSKKMNRLNLWGDKEALKLYLSSFQEAYPQYVHKSSLHDPERLFFAVPIDFIERVYYPRRGLKELMSMPISALDEHLKNVQEFVTFLLQSGLVLKDFGITYSTLMGHYLSEYSDLNIVVYGKENFWKLMKYLEMASHPSLHWKTEAEWIKFLENRDRFTRFGKEKAIEVMKRKKSEVYFNNKLFVIFAAEKEEETWFKWGAEKYKQLDLATITGIVKNNISSVVRPGCYEVDQVQIKEGSDLNVSDTSKLNNIKKVVFYNRDYCMLGYPGEKIEACGVLEEVIPKEGESYHRLVVGYFDAYISDRREKEYIKVIEDNNTNSYNEVDKLVTEDASLQSSCPFCREIFLKIGEKGEYGAVVVCKVGNEQTGWYATISPKTGGNPEEDFTIQIMPFAHFTHFSQLAEYAELAKNYGIIFAKICKVMANIIAENPNYKSTVEKREEGIAIATYGKCTTWKEKKEHLHLKIFQFRNNLWQPSVVDSTFGKKEIEKDEKGEFVRMQPVRKTSIPSERFKSVSETLIKLLQRG